MDEEVGGLPMVAAVGEGWKGRLCEAGGVSSCTIPIISLTLELVRCCGVIGCRVD